MFHRIQQYELVEAGGNWYRPRAYAERQPDDRWHGWLVFFPTDGGLAIAPPGPDTTQSTRAALDLWASGVTPIYLEGALDRALAVASHSPLVDRLTAAEYEAEADAVRLETAAAAARAEADFDEAAAAAAREDAEDIRQERVLTEAAIAATEEAGAALAAEVHERSAEEARAIAADAEQRRRTLETQASSSAGTKRRSRKKRG